jgi:hypothetical protein
MLDDSCVSTKGDPEFDILEIVITLLGGFFVSLFDNLETISTAEYLCS